MGQRDGNSTTYILFDVDGVLIHGYHAKPELRQCWDEHLERDFGVRRSDFTEIFIKEVFVEQVLVGKRDLKHALDEVLPHIGYSGDTQPFIDYWLQNDSNVNHDLFPHIEALGKLPDVELHIATNQEHNRAMYLMNELGFGNYFADIYYSGRVGCLKPNPLYFDYIANDLGITIQDHVIFYDDTQTVIDGALEAGWEAHQFDETKDIFKSDTVRALLAA